MKRVELGRGGREMCLSPRTQQILEQLGRTSDPVLAQRLSELVLLLEEERRCGPAAEPTAADAADDQPVRTRDRLVEKKG